MSARSEPTAGRMAMYSANKLKIGLFGANCSSGRAVTKVPERWSGNWPDNLRLARMADEAGIEFLLPIGRWKGYGGEDRLSGHDARNHHLGDRIAGLDQASHGVRDRARAAVQSDHRRQGMVTADHVGEGRFGLNIVVGWNEGEFEMFGVKQRDHEQRYDTRRSGSTYQDDLVGPEEFDFKGKYLDMKAIRGKPKPYGGGRPLIMNAGASPTGQAFAIRNCDAFFLQASRTSLDETAQKVAHAKNQAKQQGRELGVYTVGVVTCKPTKKAAEEYYHHRMVEHADWSAVDGILALKNITPQTVPMQQFVTQRSQFAQGLGGLAIVGDPDRVAQQIADLSEAGLTGIALSLVNYADELPYFSDEVLPRLERAGVRGKQITRKASLLFLDFADRMMLVTSSFFHEIGWGFLGDCDQRPPPRATSC